MGDESMTERRTSATAPDLVLIEREVAEWATHWHARCETGRRVTRLAAKWTLILFGAAGAIAYAIVQVIAAANSLYGLRGH